MYAKHAAECAINMHAPGVSIYKRTELSQKICLYISGGGTVYDTWATIYGTAYICVCCVFLNRNPPIPLIIRYSHKLAVAPQCMCLSEQVLSELLDIDKAA